MLTYSPRSATGRVVSRCRCHKRRPPNAVPHRTDNCEATSAAVVRCEQPSDTQATTLDHQQIAALTCGSHTL